MNDVTRILTAIEQGDPQAAEQLLPLVYDELRRLAAQKLAQEKPGQTLQATALVHEAYLRLVDAEPKSGAGTVAAISLPPLPRRCGGSSLTSPRQEACRSTGRPPPRRSRRTRNRPGRPVTTVCSNWMKPSTSLPGGPDTAAAGEAALLRGAHAGRCRRLPRAISADRGASMGLCPRLALCAVCVRLRPHADENLPDFLADLAAKRAGIDNRCTSGRSSMNGKDRCFKAIFIAALDSRAPDELRRYLDQACGATRPARTRRGASSRAHR